MSKIFKKKDDLKILLKKFLLNFTIKKKHRNKNFVKLFL